MVVILKLKAIKGYKYINTNAIKYFEPCPCDDSRAVIYFIDGTSVEVDVDAQLIAQELGEILEGLTFGTDEEEDNEEEDAKIKH